MIIDQLFARSLFEAADPSKLIVSVRIEPMSTGGEPIDKEVDLTGQFQGSMGSQMNQALDYMKKMLESKDLYFTTLKVSYQGRILNMQNRGAMSPQSDEEREMDAMANQIRAKRQITTPTMKEEAPMASPEQIAYNQLRAQWNGYQAMTSGGGNTYVSRDPAHAAKLATIPAQLAKMAAALKAKGIDAEAEYDAIGGPKSAPVDINQVYGGVAEGKEQQWTVTVGTKTGGTSHTMTFSGTKEQAIKKAVARFGTSKNPVVNAVPAKQGVAEGSLEEDKGMTGYNAFKREWRAKHGADAKVPAYDSKEYTSYVYRQNDKKQGVAEGKEDKIAQLKKDHETAVHWSKNEKSPQKREAARQKAEKIKAHLEKQYKQGVGEGDAGLSKDAETNFHAKLDQLVHATFGKRKSEQGMEEDDSALNAFLSKGGKVQQLPYKKPRKADKTDYGSKHIGGGGDKMKASRTGTAAKTQGSKVVGVSEDTYFESLQQMVERQLEPNMELDTWVDNFQNADPNKYHQFKNKTPEKKK